MAINLTDPVFTDEAKAREYLEEIRWPDGPVCPHCGETERVYRLNGQKHRPGLIHCNACEGAFTVTTGSVMESSHLPLTKWVLAYRLMAGSKKGMSAHQLHRTIGVTYKTAWFLWHRIREAMRDTSVVPLGGVGKVVESDETYVGGKPRKSAGPKPDVGRHRRVNQDTMGRATKKTPVVALVERGGRAVAKPVIDASAQTLTPLLRQHVDFRTQLMTDEWRAYLAVGKEFASHERVNHGAGEYARGDANMNSAEAFFALLERGIVGSFHHISVEHLDRYCDEFAFRWSLRSMDDSDRAAASSRAASARG
jgi:transposase-like protein